MAKRDSGAKNNQTTHNTVSVIPEHSLLEAQIEMIKLEYEMTQSEIREFSKKSQACRNWTITLWAGAIAFSVAPNQANDKSFLLLSAIFPLMFWLQDVKWTQLQRIFILRGKLITDFFSSDNFQNSIGEGRVVGFNISGLRKSLSTELFSDPEYHNFSSFWRVFFFPTKMTFYPMFIVASVAIHLYFNWHQTMSLIHTYSNPSHFQVDMRGINPPTRA